MAPGFVRPSPDPRLAPLGPPHPELHRGGTTTSGQMGEPNP